MSLKKSAARRLPLLAGSSLVLASLSAFAFTGATLAPTAVLAQATCSSPPAPAGNGTTNVTIATNTAATAYNPGISCTYIGMDSTVTTAGAVTVSSAAGGNGINLSATGTNAVNWVSTAGTVTAGSQTNGPLIDATSQSGDINITTNGLTANTIGTTHAIRATSTGGGSITINRVGTGIVNSIAVGGVAAIEATTNGGAINITTTGGTNGRLRGILAQTSGTGAITLNIGGSVGANATDGVAGIDTVTGTGATRINITSGTVSGGAGIAIRSASASTSATAAVNIQNSGGTVNGGVDFSGVTAGGVTFNNSDTGRWTAKGASVFSADADTLTMAGSGTNTAAAGTTIDFGAGDDAWNLSTLLTVTDTAVDFGAGTDAFNMSGPLAVSGALTLDNLEAFNNSGVIYLGGTTGTATDLTADDVLRMTSGTFTGSGDSRVVMDVFLGGAPQAGCETIVSGDCLDLRGASSAGVTALTVNDINPDAAGQGGYDPAGVTLVDVGGAGTSAAGDFVLDSNSTGYVADYGGAIGRPGLFVYALRYDPATQRHNLVGLPRASTMEYAVLPGAARSIWQMTTDATLGRQTDLRAGTEGEVWLRATGEYSKRDVSTGFENYGDTFAFDDAYKLYAGTIIGGMDLASGTSGGYDYVLGAQLGYVGSSFDLDASDSSGRMTGATGGVYGSFWNSRFFFDGTFNTNFLTLDYDQPSFGSKTNTWLRSVGAQGEAGMRLALGERFYAEPLADAAFSYTTFEELSLAGGEIRPDDAQSRRAALGLRVGADYPGQSVHWSYFVTGRAWHEFDGESRVVVKNPGADLVYADDFSGTFSEFEAGLNLSNDAGTVSGFVTSGVKAKSGFSAVDLSTGLRLRW
jgi:hypothetical protein